MNTFTIRTAASKLKKSEQYIRKCIREGKLNSSLVQIGASKIKRHQISENDLQAFASRSSKRTSREDGRNKFVVYLTASEEASIRKILKTNSFENVEKLLARANPSKK